ncbi:phosphotransferase [Pseudacidovorax intermedius]|uniref:phosphotransferase n=1 Tax=Pseudacidovorax intermedius TaxID=433924 RepID=UPI0003491FBF|nr:phosphotransferase [Pseudacidovorax intermedius]
MSLQASDPSGDEPEAFERLPEAAVLCAPPAPVDVAEAAGLLKQHYGLAGTLTALGGERDANFLLQPGGGGAPCMLKVSHPVESAVVADFQTQALLHLAATAPDLPVQRVLPALSGEFAVVETAIANTPRVVRLFSYLDGLPLPKAPPTAGRAAHMGTLLARLDAALAGLTHAAGGLPLPWDLQRGLGTRSLLAHVDDPARRALAQAALDHFGSDALPVLRTLPRQPIHNDFNPSNLLVDPRAPERLVGILDFGDMVVAPRVVDLAVAASYQLDAQAPAASIAAFAGAYHAVAPLSATERALLPALVATRLAMVVAISGWRAAREPANAAYLLRNNGASWARLTALADLPAGALDDALRHACP